MCHDENDFTALPWWIQKNILLNKTFKYHSNIFFVLPQRLFSAVIQDPVENSICFVLREPGQCQRPGWPIKKNHLCSIILTLMLSPIVMASNEGEKSFNLHHLCTKSWKQICIHGPCRLFLKKVLLIYYCIIMPF